MPAGLTLRYLGTDSDGKRWVFGAVDGATVVDDSPLGAEGELVFFVAEMGSEGETWIRIVWDGAGDALPEGEILAINPGEVTEIDGLRLTETSALVAQLDESGAVERWLSAANGRLVRATVSNGRIVAQVMGDGSEIVSLHVEDRAGTTMVPLEAESPETSFWLLELDPESGAILRQRAYDVGPAGTVADDRRDAHAQPLAGGRFLVATRPAGQLVADLFVDGWDLVAPVPIPLTVARGSGCVAMVHGSELATRIPLARESAVAELSVRCEAGPHRIELGGSELDFDGAWSASVFRVAVE